MQEGEGGEGGRGERSARNRSTRLPRLTRQFGIDRTLTPVVLAVWTSSSTRQSLAPSGSGRSIGPHKGIDDVDLVMSPGQSSCSDI